MVAHAPELQVSILDVLPDDSSGGKTFGLLKAETVRKDRRSLVSEPEPCRFVCAHRSVHVGNLRMTMCLTCFCSADPSLPERQFFSYKRMSNSINVCT